VDINVEEIMRKIRERVEEKKKEGAYKEDLDKLAREVLASTSPTRTAAMIGKDLERNLHLANLNWNIEDYTITSRGGPAGYFIILFKKVIRFIVRPWIGVIIHRQALFNFYLVRVLNSLAKKVKRGERETKHRLDKIEGLLESRKIEKEDFPYFAFENKHRGSREEIKKRQSIYLEYFKGSQNVLDIGCGRGEFLELLKNNGIDGYGIDTDEEMVSFCQKRGLNVQNTEGISHLMWLENDSLDGIFMDQVIEHLQPRELAKIIKLSHEKLKGGTYFIAVTPNPISLIAGPSFYVDLTHTRPVHWETMQFLLESDGFRDIKIKFVSPVPEGVELEKIEKRGQSEFTKLVEPLNKNIEKLNNLIYAPRDYAIIAMK
jgi:O-antigen chain-terminating methyltransferase